MEPGEKTAEVDRDKIVQEEVSATGKVCIFRTSTKLLAHTYYTSLAASMLVSVKRRSESPVFFLTYVVQPASLRFCLSTTNPFHTTLAAVVYIIYFRHKICTIEAFVTMQFCKLVRLWTRYRFLCTGYTSNLRVSCYLAACCCSLCSLKLSTSTRTYG